MPGEKSMHTRKNVIRRSGIAMLLILVLGAVLLFETARPLHTLMTLQSRSIHTAFPWNQPISTHMQSQGSVVTSEQLQEPSTADLGSLPVPSKEAGPADTRVAAAALPSTHPAEQPAVQKSKYLHTLTRKDIQARAQNGVIIMALGNHHYMPFVLNWVNYVRRCHMHNYVVGALDDDTAREMLIKNIHTISLQQGKSAGKVEYGSRTFIKAQHEKLRFLMKLLRLGVQELVSDLDVVWFRNPLFFFHAYPEADLLISSDNLSPSWHGRPEALEDAQKHDMLFNIGIALYRNGSMPLLEAWLKVLEQQPDAWDQWVVDEMLRDGARTIPGNPNNYFLAWKGTIKTGILPVAYFPSGHIYFVQKLHRQLGVDPYMAHNTFVMSEEAGKVHRFREALLWTQDPPEHFLPEGVGFMTYTPRIPQQLLDGSGPATNQEDLENARGHFRLINHQLRELRTALALATSLNRTLILPQLWCGLETYWGPHNGRIPTSQLPLPYQCPADHVLDLTEAMKDRRPSVYGPDIGLRESSFLRNPRLPHEVLQKAVNITICQPGTTNCSNGSVPATLANGSQLVALQANLDSDSIATALYALQSAPLLRFDTMQSAFGIFSTVRQTSQFMRRTQSYTHQFCCADLPVGHVFYDMWWDVPHTDRFGRRWNGTWYPLPGPMLG